MGFVKAPQESVEDIIRKPKTSGTLEEKRETARQTIATKLVNLVIGLYIVFLFFGSVMVLAHAIEFRDLLDLILSLGAISGFLGTAINFYFKD